MSLIQQIIQSAILISLIVVIESQMYEGDRCIHAERKESGVCSMISNCPTALNDLKTGKYPQICGFKTSKPVICCTRTTRNTDKKFQSNQNGLNFDSNRRTNSFTTHKNGIDFQQDWQNDPRPFVVSSSQIRSTKRPVEDNFFDNVPNFETSFSYSGRPGSQNGFGINERPKSQNGFENTEITSSGFISSGRPNSQSVYNNNGRPSSQSAFNNNVRPNSQSELNNNRRPNSNGFENSGSTSRPLFDNGRPNFPNGVNNNGFDSQNEFNNNGRPDSQNGFNNNGRPDSQNGFNNNGRPDSQNGFSNNGRPNTQSGFNNNVRPTNGRPIGNGDVSYPKEEDLGPDVVAGPDDTRLSNSQRRRAASVAEIMCQNYSATVVEHVQGIPLLLNPEPIEVDVPRCVLDSVPLVVGGKLARYAEFPHMVALGWPLVEGSGYAWSCGGSLISESFVLTAAHCTYQDRDISTLSGAPRVVHVGDNHLGSRDAQIIQIEKAIKYPQYKPPQSYHDIALLKLKTPARLSESTRPACLGSTPNSGQAVIATGWGRTENRGRQSEDLRAVQLSVTAGEDCSRSLGVSRRLPMGPLPTQVCAGDDRGGKDTCQGDSGGPLQIRSTDNRCIAHIVGITSLGRSCGEKHTPALYTRVSSYIPFIVQVVWPDRI